MQFPFDQSLASVVVFVAGGTVCAALLLLMRDLVFGGRRLARQQMLVRPLPPYDTVSRGMMADFRRLIYETGLGISPLTALGLILMSGLLLGGSLGIWFDEPLPAFVGLVIGVLLPLPCFAWRRARYLRQLQEQLPDAVDLLMRAVRAGESLDQAIALAAEEIPKPLGLEFQRCARQLDMGLSVASAVQGLAQRVPMLETRIFAATLAVHRRAGGNLATALERLASVIRDRISYRRQFRAASAGGRMAALLISSVGVLAFVVLWIVQPEYLKPFFEQPIGWALLGTAVMLQVVGLLWVFAMLRNSEEA